ncbi:site-specific integrase [Clostridium botulinum]|uniref:site-specific integrase n=1 Tax=Clostridium botulinum TaxID=1491 RepID=UPI0007DFAC67|nr:site-specific integrase [Clostridium botulinum]KEI92270.1 integrase [Clostridium botulinum B2 275]
MDYNITYRKKDKGIQVIISYKVNGKWKQKSKQGFKKKNDAKRAADKLLDDLKCNIENSLNTDYGNITFKDFTIMFLEHEILYKEPGTIRSYRFALNRFKELNDLELSKINTMQIQTCVDNMIKTGLASSTTKLYVSKLNTIFSNAIKPYNLIAKNPVDGIKILKSKKQEKIKALDKAKLKDLLGKINYKKYYIASLIAATCGLRIGEILGLTWADIDEINSTLTVNKQWKKLKSGNWGFGSVKSKNSNRVVPISPNTLKELKSFKKNSVTDIHNRIIVCADSINLSRGLRDCYKRNGYDISIHDLRHTYATMLIGNGVDFKTAAKLLGHTVEMTMKTYAHVNDDMINKATNLIEKIF